MGMFDTVIIKCPRCGTATDAQSKGGNCNLTTYELNEAPADVLADINRHSPFQCENCKALFTVELKILAIERLV